jgi:hypothetical protein
MNEQLEALMSRMALACGIGLLIGSWWELPAQR